MRLGDWIATQATHVMHDVFQQKKRRLKDLMAQQQAVPSLGVHDALSALVAQRVGFKMLFLGGFGVSASRLGLPDLNFLGLRDMEQAVGDLTAVLEVPLIVDADTGHGDLPHVRRTVQRLAAAGASGILLEDQRFPKRCGHFAGKEVIPVESMMDKVRVAVEARPDEDFLIVARTDARACHGLDDALERIGAYARCGADVGFVEAPQSVEELKRIPLETPIPQMANMLLGGVTPILNWRELEHMGFKWVVSPVETLAVCMSAMQAMMTTFLQEGSLEDFMQGKATLDDLKDLLALERWQSGASVDQASDTGPHTLLP